MSKLEELIKEFCPNGVEYKKLGELGKFYGGLSGKSKNDFTNGNEKFITYKNVYANPSLNLDIEDRVKINPGERQNTLQYGDIIFTGSSETPDECGFSSVITTKTSEKLFLNSFCFFFRLDNQSILLPDFAKHLLRSENIRYQIGKTASGVTRYNVSKDKMKQVQIPLPALPVQREIVRVLDSFTLYSAELTAELTARRKQYEFYRDKLLTFSQNDFEWTILEKIAVYTNGKGHENNVNEKGKYILINSKFVSTKGEVIKFVDEQFSPIYQNEFAMVLSDLPNGRALAKCFFVLEDDRYTVNQRICKISNINEKILPKFLFYYMDRNKYFLAKDNGVDQTNLSKEYVLQMPIPVLPLAFQKRIVYVLDNFDAICSDLGIGLPAEIEKRQKQYEYYREKLLTFDMKPETIFRQTDRQTDRQTGLIRLLQYVYGFAFVRLGDVADYSTNRITAKSVDKNNYVGVDNLLADRQGKTESVYVPENGNLIEFRSENTLIGNIRPYLKKIWFANCNGGTNGDVLVIKANEDYVMPKYLYYVLSSDKFFAFDMQYAKGAKMPRGNKAAIMTYQFSLPTLDKQKEIVAILDKFDSICNDLSAGLPAEIEHRQKQYEFYRDKLLTFKG